MDDLDTSWHMRRLQRKLLDPVFKQHYEDQWQAMVDAPINRAARRKLMGDTIGFGNFFARHIAKTVWDDAE
jgi:hypothetical protein